MKLCTLILKEEDLLDDLLKKLTECGYNEISVIDSNLYESKKGKKSGKHGNILSSIRYVIDYYNDESKIVFLPCKEERIDELKKVIIDLVPEHQYIFFTIQIENLLGCIK